MSPERATFLDDLIVTLIENFRTLTWFRTADYDCPEDGPVTATIVDDEGRQHKITRDTMSWGIDVIRRATATAGTWTSSTRRRSRSAPCTGRRCTRERRAAKVKDEASRVRGLHRVAASF